MSNVMEPGVIKESITFVAAIHACILSIKRIGRKLVLNTLAKNHFRGGVNLAGENKLAIG